MTGNGLFKLSMDFNKFTIALLLGLLAASCLPDDAFSAPDAPTGVTASDGTYTDKVRVTWNAVTGATHYEIWRNTQNDINTADIKGDVDGTTYDDTTADANEQTYYYWVRGMDVGTPGAWSTPNTGWRANGGGGDAPDAPTGVTASDGTYTDKVRVTWTASSGALYYHVYRNTVNDSGTATVLGFDSAETTCDDTTAVAGVVYYYWVKAGNVHGDSGFSGGDPGYRGQGTISAPTGVSASKGTYTNKVRVTWNTVSRANFYNVYRNTNSNPPSIDDPIGWTDGDTPSTTYDDTIAESGITYYYWVMAGISPGVEISALSTPDTGYLSGGGPGPAPSAPTGVTASDGTYTDKVRVTWTASLGALYYHVYRNTVNDSGTATVLGFDSSDTTCDDATATADTTYYYWVKAGNMSGESGFSASDTGYRAESGGGDAPDAPTGVIARDGTDANKVLVYWTSVSSATSYKVWRSTDNNSQHATVLGTSTTSSYLDITTTAGTVYYYWIQAVNSAGVSQLSAPDSGYCGTLPSGLPIPTGIKAGDGSSTDHISVTWQGVSEATQYEIWRATENKLSAASLIKATTGTSYNDSSVAQGIYYYYWVRAGNVNGSSGFGPSDSGWCRLNTPSGVKASDGIYPYHIRVVWNAVANAAWYEVWREEVPGENSNGGNLMKVFQTGDTSFNDYYTKSGIYYLYKVKSGNGLCSSLDYGHDTGVRQVAAASTSLSVLNDYDGDKLSDLALFNSSAGVLDVLCSALGRQTFYLNAEHSEGVTGDLDGDGKADPLAYCPDSGTWRVRLSSIGYNPIIPANFGGQGNIVATADYDGDQISDIGVYNETNGVLSVLLSNAGAFDWSVSIAFGGLGYSFVPADFDGDGLADPAVYSESEGQVTVIFSGMEYYPIRMAFGGPGQSMYAADFDGDTKADPILYDRTVGAWTVLLSRAGYTAARISFGGSWYVPAIGDYDGDGLTDPAIYRESDGQWLIMFSTRGYAVLSETFGNPNFSPIQK